VKNVPRTTFRAKTDRTVNLSMTKRIITIENYPFIFLAFVFFTFKISVVAVQFLDFSFFIRNSMIFSKANTENSVLVEGIVYIVKSK